MATGEADVAYGSDTGGSIRIPAACCGVAGLKTTWGRIPLTGVWPLAPSLDTVGPMARDVAGLDRRDEAARAGIHRVRRPARVVGRVAIGADPSIDRGGRRGAGRDRLGTSPVVLAGLDRPRSPR